MAGIDNIVCGSDINVVKAVAKAAPNTLITGVLSFDQARISDESAIRNALDLMEAGADMVYTTGIAPERIKRLTLENIPCVAHVGLIPYLSTWIGGLRAVGKTAKEAHEIYEHALQLDDAGVIAVEMECVAHKVAAEITKNVKLLTLSMGSGPDCDGQYLFATDLLGSHNDHYPRHSVTYGDFFKQSVEIFKLYKEDVLSGEYPKSKHVIEMADNEFHDFLSRIR
jgi:3-methyl-2-oxobutanoate hydroxymethyltransferase